MKKIYIHQRLTAGGKEHLPGKANKEINVGKNAIGLKKVKL